MRSRASYIKFSLLHPLLVYAAAATVAEEGSKRKAMRSEKHLRSDVHHDHLYGNKEPTVDGNDGRRPVTAEAHNRQGKKMPSYISSEVKVPFLHLLTDPL